MKYDSIAIEMEFSTGNWTDITSDYIAGSLSGTMGIHGWNPEDRVADIGKINFSLNNFNNKYTPGHLSCTSGFAVGVHVRLKFTYQTTKVRYRFYGTVLDNGITIDSDGRYTKTNVTASDYMALLASHELYLPTFAEDKSMDEIVPLIVANMAIAPLSTSYGSGADTFETVFDTTRKSTFAMSEIAKVALSELGFVYIAQNEDTSAEVLVTEGRYSRNGATIAQPTLWDGDSFEAADAHFDNNMIGMSITHGNNYFNQVMTRVYPRDVDAAATTVLFTLNRYIAITAGATVYITGRFIDPEEQAQSVCGIEMVDPVATTDYLFNAASDGSGADITADLTVNATYGANGVEYELINGNAGTGYVTFLQARGKGVYIYRPVEFYKEDSTLIDADGKHSIIFDMKYQSNPLIGEDFAPVLLDLYKTKRTTVESVTFCANESELLLNSFIDLNIGDKISLSVDSIGMVEKEYFIQGINFNVQQGEVVFYSYDIIEAALATAEGFWEWDVALWDTTTVWGY